MFSKPNEQKTQGCNANVEAACDMGEDALNGILMQRAEN
jgi:hypothetical protein